jgi:hypothetical protein
VSTWLTRARSSAACPAVVPIAPIVPKPPPERSFGTNGSFGTSHLGVACHSVVSNPALQRRYYRLRTPECEALITAAGTGLEQDVDGLLRETGQQFVEDAGGQRGVAGGRPS